jgi:regulation of enolase protein 1 (concanavalin A-like superfamily)
MNEPFNLSAIPVALQWKNSPIDWSVEPGDSLTVMADKETDWFVDPAGGPNKNNAPVALFAPPDSSFLLSARVRVDFAASFDAGVLHIRADNDRWAKLCFEYSPQRQPMIVSVVTRGVSDDCNSAVIDGQEVYLRIAYTPQTIAFHYSLDGRYWHLARYFTLGKPDSLQVGFSSQAPTGTNCKAVFSEISYRVGTLKNNRNGE